MGGESSKPKKIRLDKLKFEISVLKVKAHLELQRDRRQNELTNKERALIKMIASPTRQKQDEIHKASSIVSDKKFVKACDIIIRYCDILKDRSTHICDSKGDAKVVEELLPFIESVIWAAKPLNLAAIGEFQTLMTSFYGPSIYDEVQKSTKVDPELKACFKDLMPTPTEINDFFIEFSQKHGVPLEKINECGLEIVGKNPGDLPGFGGNPGGGGGNVNPYPQPINYAPNYPNYPNYQPMGQNDPNVVVLMKNQPNYQPQYYPPNPNPNVNQPYPNMNQPQTYPPPPNNMNYPQNDPFAQPYPQNNYNMNPNPNPNPYGNINPNPNPNPYGNPNPNPNPNPYPNNNINNPFPNNNTIPVEKKDDLPSLDDFEARMKRLRDGGL